MMAKSEKEFNRLDILVHNASNFNKCPFMEVTEEIWESSFGVNLKGPFFVSQAAAKLMQSLAIALSPNIQCNAICPTSIYPSEFEKDQFESLIKEKDAKIQEDFTIYRY
jgi:NAD(P)-dependent dehydrogenase (short-subunit alcohol dehydrogenase family)